MASKVAGYPAAQRRGVDSNLEAVPEEPDSWSLPSGRKSVRTAVLPSLPTSVLQSSLIIAAAGGEGTGKVVADELPDRSRSAPPFAPTSWAALKACDIRSRGASREQVQATPCTFVRNPAFGPGDCSGSSGQASSSQPQRRRTAAEFSRAGSTPGCLRSHPLEFEARPRAPTRRGGGEFSRGGEDAGASLRRPSSELQRSADEEGEHGAKRERRSEEGPGPQPPVGVPVRQAAEWGVQHEWAAQRSAPDWDAPPAEGQAPRAAAARPATEWGAQHDWATARNRADWQDAALPDWQTRLPALRSARPGAAPGGDSQARPGVQDTLCALLEWGANQSFRPMAVADEVL